MASVSVASAKDFVARAEVPPVNRTRGAAPSTVDLALEAAKNQAALVGSDKVTINTGVLDGVGPAIKQKLADHAAEFVKQLPDLN